MVVRVTAAGGQSSGSASVVNNDFDAVLYARETCAEGGVQLACADAGSSGVSENLSYAVEGPVFIFIDSEGGNDDFSLSIF